MRVLFYINALPDAKKNREGNSPLHKEVNVMQDMIFNEHIELKGGAKNKATVNYGRSR